MPHLDAKPNYRILLNSDEFRLVTLALAGRLDDQEDVDNAMRLNTQLCRQRATQLKEACDYANKTLELASELENPNVPPKKG